MPQDYADTLGNCVIQNWEVERMGEEIEKKKVTGEQWCHRRRGRGERKKRKKAVYVF